jgi:hypothetical protein
MKWLSTCPRAEPTSKRTAFQSGVVFNLSTLAPNALDRTLVSVLESNASGAQ